MDFLIKPLLEIEEYRHILDLLRNYPAHVNISGPSDSQKAHLCYALCRHTQLKGIYIAFNEMQARKLFDDFSYFFGEDVVFFPAKEIMLHDVEAKSYDAVHQRIKALGRIVNGEYRIVVTSAEAVIQKLIPADFFKECRVDLSKGQRIDLSGLVQKLSYIGYERVGTVEGNGQFAVRGGIVDIFPINYESPVRMELFDDEIDSLRRFDALTQRSIDKLERIHILPAREVIYPSWKRDEIIARIRGDLDEMLKRSSVNSDYRNSIKDKIESDIENIKNSHYFPGIDKYIPYIIENPDAITGYISEDTLIFLDEPVRIKQRIDNVLLEHCETCKSFIEKAKMLPGGMEVSYDYDRMINLIAKYKCVCLNTLSIDRETFKKSKSYNIACRQLGSYDGHFELLVEQLRSWKAGGNRVLILAGTKGKGERLAESISSNEIECVYLEQVDEIKSGQIVITRGGLNKGFEYTSVGFVIVSDRELLGRDKKLKKFVRKNNGNKIHAFTDLSPGDFVVHQIHGIGQYEGIQQLVVENIKRDYLKIRYQQGDYLYIPTSQLDAIQKYIGPDGKSPKLNKLGGTDWAKTKARVKESLRELAAQLVKLYAKRQSIKGYAFSPDTVWQTQFEELFPYEETEEQLKCIREIKQDMESEKPMDRLLCGDVGYGKTEVAMRAVFKAVMDGKQVAYLVPTTILAQQQYNNFKTRMADFPIKVDVISRFRSKAEQKKILQNVRAGTIDVLIGTHRLIQKDIQFKDLGLLVIDEEQKFGVEHKEKLKNIYPHVDVLTLTATPIPRTLHMSLSGIRDISTIEEPPEERYPVQTYVMEYDAEVIKDAIMRELGRNGQVFYLYNRVRSIYVKAAEIQAMVPEARISVGHGQMNEKELEDVMFRFINGESDILVCTTIIESGLDMPNVNTIIVEDADKMGLAQLYQLRGRVGRSNRLAYAYITYKRDKVLPEIAEKRLQAIKEFTEFGSGFKIAIRDLEIRGAGNLLGPEQHGHLESVGYDMYCRLLDEAVRELRGMEPEKALEEVSIDLNINAYIDDEYIEDEKQKIEMYKRIASIQDAQDVVDVQDELIDRYGDMPEAVENLIRIAYIKSLAARCGFVSLQEKKDSVVLQYGKGAKVNLQLLSRLMDKYKRKLMFTANTAPYITFKTDGISRGELLENIKILLQDIINLQ